MPLSNNAKLGIVAAVAATGLFFLTRDASASTDTPDDLSDAETLGDTAGCAAGTADAKAKKMKGTSDQLATLAAADFSASGLSSTSDITAFTKAFFAAYNRCYNENIGGTTGGGGGGTILFDPSKATNGVGAHALALSIKKTEAPDSAISRMEADGKDPDSMVFPLSGEYRYLAAFIQYDPTAPIVVPIFQRYAGITPDGKYGTETQKAYTYFLTHNGL